MVTLTITGGTLAEVMNKLRELHAAPTPAAPETHDYGVAALEAAAAKAPAAVEATEAAPAETAVTRVARARASKAKAAEPAAPEAAPAAPEAPSAPSAPVALATPTRADLDAAIKASANLRGVPGTLEIIGQFPSKSSDDEKAKAARASDVRDADYAAVIAALAVPAA